MSIFAPDDFAGRPYVGGMNQALHHVFGSALVGWSHYIVTNNIWLCLAIAMSLFGTWELYQRLFKGATRKDFIADLLYWTSGAITWALLIGYDLISGAGVMYPTFALCIWVIEYTRLQCNE